jgi:hypothetical protein
VKKIWDQVRYEFQNISPRAKYGLQKVFDPSRVFEIFLKKKLE